MTTATSAKRNSMLLMALCAIMWSLGGIFIKLISWNPLLICGVRSVIAALILGGYMFVTRTPVNFNKYSFGAGIGLSTSCIFFVFANKLKMCIRDSSRTRPHRDPDPTDRQPL